jgi:hypothetical protein
VRAVLGLILIAAVSGCGAIAAQKPATPAQATAIHPCGKTGAAAPKRWAHVVWIVMENRSYSDLLGPSGPQYMRSLAAACGSATNFHAETHPSLPNYIAMTSGSTHGVRDDASPPAHPLRGASLFSQLGGRWRALQESMPKPCLRVNAGLYAPKHNPAAYYTGIRHACQKQDVRLGTTPDLSARFTFITPNLCHDTHSCPLSSGDQYLAALMPKIVNSTQYRAGKTAVFITYDEDDGSQSNRIPTLVISPVTQPGTTAATRFSHYSLLRTTEEMLGLKKLGAAKNAPSMRAAFGL